MNNLNNCQCLQRAFDEFNNYAEINVLHKKFQQVSQNEIISIYEAIIPVLENIIWENSISKANLQLYQNLFCELEKNYPDKQDERHHILLVIPVADRPQHLKTCLESILTLCKTYYYGGKDKQYRKVSVLIAEDSLEENNIAINKKIIRRYSESGLDIIYFSLDEQREQILNLNSSNTPDYSGIIGELELDSFSHKGASITRNITYIKLSRIYNQYKNVLFYFIDSDQEFKVNYFDNGVEISSYAINYFYYLDKLFTDSGISVLTGKVVGDPPVSPSVMAANFLEDVQAFISKITMLNPDSTCKFHNHQNIHKSHDAIYHDMAMLFGFSKKEKFIDYQCTLEHQHTNSDCFNDFTSRINQFFDGVHLTRKTYYQYGNILDGVVPARTIYTGNYVFTPDALKYFIPFAPLKLRMAGPTMGRFLRHELGCRFVSANLPMLHGRIVEFAGKSEFRPGIKHTSELISLAGEFERQYYGDVMLFSIDTLLEAGQKFEYNAVRDIVTETESFLRRQYLLKINEINDNLICLEKTVSPENNLWFKENVSSEPASELERFINNIEMNFGAQSAVMKLVSSDNPDATRLASIIKAILQLRDDMLAWGSLIKP